MGEFQPQGSGGGGIKANESVTLSNKTLDNTNVITIKDANLTVQDDLDTSKQVQFQASGISVATMRTIALQDADITMESTAGSQGKVNTHSTLTTGIHGLVVTTPTVDQVLKYNGVNFINAAGVVANVGPGVIFYLDHTKIIPAGAGPQTVALETLFKTPSLAGEIDESAIVNNSAALIDQYMYDTALGISSIDSGEWTFNTYCYVSAALGTSEAITSIGKVMVGTGTIAITGAGTSRTATVTGATPFVASDFNVDITQTSYVITPTAVLRITGFTSTSVVAVETLGTYANESGVSYSLDRYLFQSTTGALTNTSIGLATSIRVEPAFSTNTTDKLSARYYAKTDNVGNVTIHTIHGGTVHYTNFHTPLTTKHNDLPGLQGGAANEEFHSTAAEYTKIQALGTISSQAANNVAITGGTIANLTMLTTRNHNDLQNRNAIATHPSESIGIVRDSAMFPQDIGKNWKNLGVISTLIFSSSYLGNGIVIFGNSLGHVIRSTDYGATRIDLGVISDRILSMSYLGNGIVVLGTRNGHIFRSTDFGITWTDLGVMSADQILSMSYLGNGIVIAGDSLRHIFRSTDYGATWTDLGVISTGAIDSMSYLGNGIVVFGNDLGRIVRSTDFGATWTDLGVISTNVVYSISYLGNGIVVFGDGIGHIFRSTDFGATWTNLGVISTIIIYSTAYLGNGIVIAGDSLGHIFRSTDYGATWTDLGVISTDAIRTISYLGNGIVVFGNGGGGVFRSDIAYKLDEAQANFPRIRTDVTASRALNTTYTNNDTVRTLHIVASVRCAITVAAGQASAQGKSDASTPPTTVASGTVGIRVGLLNEDNSFEVSLYAMPGKNYRIDSTAVNGTVTLENWFETLI